MVILKSGNTHFLNIALRQEWYLKGVGCSKRVLRYCILRVHEYVSVAMGRVRGTMSKIVEIKTSIQLFCIAAASC